MKNEVICANVHQDASCVTSRLYCLVMGVFSQYESDMLCPHFRGHVSLQQDESHSKNASLKGVMSDLDRLKRFDLNSRYS